MPERWTYRASLGAEMPADTALACFAESATRHLEWKLDEGWVIAGPATISVREDYMGVNRLIYELVVPIQRPPDFDWAGPIRWPTFAGPLTISRDSLWPT